MPVSAAPWLSFIPCSTFRGQNIDTRLVRQWTHDATECCYLGTLFHILCQPSPTSNSILNLNLLSQHSLSRTSISTFIHCVAISNNIPALVAASNSDINCAFAVKPSVARTAAPTETPASESPIRVTHKSKPTGSKRAKNVFHDDRGFPDQSHEFDTILHSINGGCILCKQKHPAPPINEIDPKFHAV